MEILQGFMRLIEFILYISMTLFIASTVYLISVVKKSNYGLVKDAITNPILPNIDFGFFKKLRVGYLKVRKNWVPAVVNRITFWTMIGGFLSLFVLVIIQELMSY